MTKTTEYKSDFIGEKYFKIEHDSGLDVYVYPKEQSVLSAVLSINYGSSGSSYYSTETNKIERFPEGIAHFLEHKMFEDEGGTDKTERFNEIGAYINAYTSYAETAYTLECTKSANIAIYELLRLVRTPNFTEESTSHEKYIIEQEIKSAEDDPYEAGYYAALRSMYKRHSVRKKIAGGCSSIKKITAEDLYKCHRLFYVPKNMKLGICGNIDCESVIEAVDKAFSGFSSPQAEAPKIYYPREYAPVAKRQSYVSRPVPFPMVSIGIKIPKTTKNPDENRRITVAMNILTSMLFSSSEQFNNDMYDKKIVIHPLQYEYVSSTEANYSYIIIDAQSKKPHMFYKHFSSYIKKSAKKGLSRESFERTKRVYYAENIKSFDSCDYIASNLAYCAHYDFLLFDKAKIIADIEFDEVCELFHHVFIDERITVSVISNGLFGADKLREALYKE